LFVRAHIVAEASRYLARACTISIRYSAVRRQFRNGGGPQADSDPSQPETQVIDYQTQQYRLVSQLATAYAFHFTGEYMLKLYDELQAGIGANDMSGLPEVHATSSGRSDINLTLLFNLCFC